MSLLRFSYISQIILLSCSFSPITSLKLSTVLLPSSESSGILPVPHLKPRAHNRTQRPTGEQCNIIPLIRTLCLYLKSLRLLQLLQPFHILPSFQYPDSIFTQVKLALPCHLCSGFSLNTELPHFPSCISSSF